MPKRNLGVDVPEKIWKELVGHFTRAATINNTTKEVRLEEFRAYPCEYPAHAQKNLWVVFRDEKTFGTCVRIVNPQKMVAHLAETKADFILAEGLSNEMNGPFVDYREEREKHRATLG